MEKKFECKIKVFRSDEGGEYVSTEFKRFLSSNEIIHKRDCAYTPQQNGVAERKRKTGTYCCSSQMLQMHVPKYLWAEASSSICHQQNSIWCYHKGKIPWDIFHGGASALCPDSLRDQLSPKAHCSVHIAFCILLGYSPAMLWSSYDFISFGMLHSWRMSLFILMILLMHCLISVQMWDSLLPSVVPLGRPVLRQRFSAEAGSSAL